MPDHRDAPEDAHVVELLPVGEAVELRPRPEVQEVLHHGPQVEQVARLRHHRARAPEVAAFLVDDPAVGQHAEVPGEVAEGHDRGKAVQHASRLGAAEQRPSGFGAQVASANFSGRPVAASSRKLVTIVTWTPICMLLKRRTYGPVLAMAWPELAAQPADEGALQPQQVVQAEEAEHAEQQGGHADPDQVDVEVALRVRRVGVRVEAQERRVDVRVAGAAGLGQVGRDGCSSAGRMPAGWRAACGSRRRRLPSCCSARSPCRGSCRGTTRRPSRGKCRSGRRPGRAPTAVSGRLIACGSWQVEHTGPSLASGPAVARSSTTHRGHFPATREDAGVALAAGLGDLGVARRGSRLGLRMDVVLAVAARARRRAGDQPRLQQPARMFAALVVRHHLFVAATAGLDLVDRRQRRRRVTTLEDAVQAVVAAGAVLDRLVAGGAAAVDAAGDRLELVAVAVLAHLRLDRRRAGSAGA